MTLNKYQKYNEKIRLDETRKEDILNHVMEAEIRPVRRSLPGWRGAVVFACVLAVFAFLIFPRRKAAQMSSDAAEEPAMMYEDSNEAMESAAESEYNAETLSGELGYPIPAMDGLSDGSPVQYERISESRGSISLNKDGRTITILTDSEESAESFDSADAAGDTVNSAAEPEADTSVSVRSFTAGGVYYTIRFDPPAAAEEADEIEAYIRQEADQ